MKKIKETKDVITYELNDLTKIYVIKMAETEQTYVEMFFNVGSFDLNLKANNEIINFPSGIAHFLEHMMFHMSSGEDQFSVFSKKGFDANAMTSFERTIYMFTATKDLHDGIDLLLNMLDDPYFTKSRVELETKIIEEEIKMYNNDLQTNMYNDLINNMYYVHPIKYDIGGTIESINEITNEKLYDFYKYFYQPKNRSLLICGKVDINKLEKHLSKYKNNNKSVSFELIHTEEPENIIKAFEEKNKEVNIPKMMLGVKLRSDNNVKDSIVLDILLTMLFSTSSEFYEKLVNKALINRNFFYESNYYRDLFGFLMFGESTNINELINEIKAVLLDENIYLNETDFNRLKRVYKARFIYSLNNPITLGRLYLTYLQIGVDYFSINDLIDEVEFSDILKMHEIIKPENISILVYKKAK